MFPRIATFLFLLSILLIGACGENSTPENSEQTTEAEQDTTKENFVEAALRKQQETDTRRAIQPSAYEGFVEESGLIIEKPDNSKRTSAREPVQQTIDNKIFKPGRVFIYDYIYYNEDGLERYAVLSPEAEKVAPNKAYYYMPPSDLSEMALMQFKMTVLPGLGLLEGVRGDYIKSTAKYNYLLYSADLTVKEQSGLVENEHNVWMTPPRFKIFRMLEFNPYPFIQKPYEVGNKWTWEHKVKKRWGDSQWLVLHESLQNTYTYEIVKQQKLSTKIGELDCWVVESEAKNEFGEAYLTSYFNEEFGFVRLEYTNLHYTKMVIDIAEVRQLDEPEYR